MSGEDAPRPYLENLIVLEIKTKTNKNKQTKKGHMSPDGPRGFRGRASAVKRETTVSEHAR